jgi:ribosomal-protein-alanine N-acetyltransferase
MILAKYMPEPHEMAEYTITPLTEDYARQILRWRYTAPYDFYNSPDTRLIQGQYLQQFLNPIYAFHAIVDSLQQFCGFCAFGIDGQLLGGGYTEAALDIGLGMGPDLTAQGQGAAFFATILAFCQSHFCAPQLRLSVAQFNRRALALYAGSGFRKTAEFTDSKHAIAYTVLNLDVITSCR